MIFPNKKSIDLERALLNSEKNSIETNTNGNNNNKSKARIAENISRIKSGLTTIDR